MNQELLLEMCKSLIKLEDEQIIITVNRLIYDYDRIIEDEESFYNKLAVLIATNLHVSKDLESQFSFTKPSQKKFDYLYNIILCDQNINFNIKDVLEEISKYNNQDVTGFILDLLNKPQYHTETANYLLNNVVVFADNKGICDEIVKTILRNDINNYSASFVDVINGLSLINYDFKTNNDVKNYIEKFEQLLNTDDIYKISPKHILNLCELVNKEDASKLSDLVLYIVKRSKNISDKNEDFYEMFLYEMLEKEGILANNVYEKSMKYLIKNNPIDPEYEVVKTYDIGPQPLNYLICRGASTEVVKALTDKYELPCYIYGLDGFEQLCSIYIKTNQYDKALEVFEDEELELFDEDTIYDLESEQTHEMNYDLSYTYTDILSDIIFNIYKSNESNSKKINLLDKILYSSKIKYIYYGILDTIKTIYDDENKYNDFIHYLLNSNIKLIDYIKCYDADKNGQEMDTVKVVLLDEEDLLKPNKQLVKTR